MNWPHTLAPFLDWLGELRSLATLRADLIAGVTVALVLIPQSMAYAQLAGLPAYYGLYAAFLPPLVAALMGSSRQLATGPVAVVSLMTAAALEPLAAGGSEGYVAYAVLLALMVGLFQLALGLLRLGVLVNFLSHPVVLGFTNAAAIIIATSQLGKIFGVEVEKAEQHYLTVWRVLQAAAQQTHLPTLLMALLAFAVMYGLQRLNPRLPGVLAAVVITSLLSWGLGFSEQRRVTPGELVGKEVQRILDERQRLSARLTRLVQELAVAQQRLRTLRRQDAVDEQLLLETRHTVDLLRLQRERLQKTLAADLKELRAVPFTLAEDGEGRLRLYMPGHLPPAAQPRSDGWRLHDIDAEGGLRLRRGGHVVGGIPSGLPSLRLPRFDWDAILQLLSAAATIALIGFMEAIAIAKSMATRTKQHLDANQELIGQGLGNIVGSLFQSYPTAGSFSRSAINFRSGAVTGFSSVVTSLMVMVVLLWLTPLLYHLPQATLAAVIMLAVFGLVRIAPMRYAWKVDRHDGLVALVTFVLTLLLAPHLDQGIIVGVLLSLGLYLYRTMQPRVVVLGRHADGNLRDAELHRLPTCENIALLRFDGSLYFANTGYFEDKVREKLTKKPALRFVIVDAEGINQIDASGEEMLRQVAEQLRETGVVLLLSRVKRQVLEVLERSGFLDLIGREHIFRRTEHALEHAWRQLGEDHRESCPLAPPAGRRD
ncbi:SulP family inorganic anion transporter [Thiohalobacter sp. IOR34]|uniref:SulP family inorganic anion transporter n=1 Tax=Thiohalobacter sp. IOR34 TaxID=3057176 RepID=UPI0025B0C88E|nr:SulP family inorganic anion transporter [Thiohalobacter sp. IOR34]WJW75942.1 SulP family inorganic anion transporter [Thiohalobacter sp. IOR34]